MDNARAARWIVVSEQERVRRSVGRVTVHIEGARGWLQRAEREWQQGCRARAVLDLSLAEAEVRLARYAATVEPKPALHRGPAVALALAAAGLLAVAVAGGLWGSRQQPSPPAAHAPVRAVSLGYVPGAVLALVAPPREIVLAPWTSSPVDPGLGWRDLLREAQVEGLPVQAGPLR